MVNNKQIQIQIQISERLYLKDPQRTELGMKILASSVDMISEMGFEQFTFKKLATEISSTEASVYRYFENKHKLLIYLISWYWNWLAYRLSVETHREEQAIVRMKIAVQVFCHTLEPIPNMTSPLNLPALYQIVIEESPKAYLTKGVDDDNKEGGFLSYKRFCAQVADIIEEIAPTYAYPRALISTAVEAAHHQKYFSEHLPSLTEVSGGDREQVAAFLTDLVLHAISFKS